MRSSCSSSGERKTCCDVSSCRESRWTRNPVRVAEKVWGWLNFVVLVCFIRTRVFGLGKQFDSRLKKCLLFKMSLEKFILYMKVCLCVYSVMNLWLENAAGGTEITNVFHIQISHTELSFSCQRLICYSHNINSEEEEGLHLGRKVWRGSFVTVLELQITSVELHINLGLCHILSFTIIPYQFLHEIKRSISGYKWNSSMM